MTNYYMKTLSGICLLALLISACRTPENSLLSAYFNTGKLSAQSFIIDPDNDTILITDGGVRIRILSGSFEGNKPVTIEWKEALQFDDMLRAGLLTQSGTDILSSGGMFYLNTKENVDIQKPIKIEVPTNIVVQGMQLYKGDSAKGKMDWQDPQPIESIKAFGENVLGKTLFTGNCAQCHGLRNEGTGPALAGVTERKSREWLYTMTRNAAATMAVDPYLRCEKCRYGVVMQSFPNLPNGALDSLYDYIEEETERLGLTGMIKNNDCDSCVVYRSIYDSLMNLRKELYKTNNNTIDINYTLPLSPTPFDTFPDNPTSQSYENTLVEHLEQKTDYYRVEINTVGWYNVDVLLKDWSGSVQSKLIVRIQGSYAGKQEFYLAIPSVKVITQGGYLTNGRDIGFYEKDGSIPLPQQTQAFVFAVGEEKGNFYYSQTNFVTTINQTITLKAESISRETFTKKIQQLEQNGLKIKSDTTIHFSSLKSVDEQLEKMKDDRPENCGCEAEPMNTPADNTTRDTTSVLRLSLRNVPDSN